jgi:hypothetical protein
MIDYIIPVILIMSIIDIVATYNYVNTFHKKFPKLDYKQLEANMIVRICWNKLGMKLGSIIAGLITFTLLILLILFVPENFRYFIAGALFMMLIYHILNWVQLMNLKPA